MTLDYITLTPQELQKLLGAGSGEAALVYLYIKSTGDVTLKHAQRELRLPQQNLAWAESLLKRLGLLENQTKTLRFDREQAPVYSGEAITAFAAKDPSFTELQGEISRRLGRVLSTEELKTLLAIRDYLKMPPEVVSVALTYCIQKIDYYNKAHGASRTMSMRTLEKECYDWANKGIMTLEQATKFISHDLERLEPESRVKKLMGLDRPLADSEKEYIQAWLRMGFDTDTIKLAYDKTVLATGRLAWRYMNKILLNWHEKNLHTLQQVNSENSKQPPPETTGFTPGAGEKAAVTNLQKFRDSLKE